MGQILIGLVLLVVGHVACFFGFRFWFILLPIFGGVVGFFIGVRAIQAIVGEGFLSTAVSWVVGIFVGMGFALVSWYIWYGGRLSWPGQSARCLLPASFTRSSRTHGAGHFSWLPSSGRSCFR